MIKTQELQTLKTIADRDYTGEVSRSHLEKLSRLDLIEPCAEGVCLTPIGKQILVKRK